MNPFVNAERIESAYERLGYSIGWRFMTCPERQFDNPRVLLASLNPSGRVEHGPRWSQEAGSAYVIESWDGQPPGRDTLQIQIQRLVAHLDATFDEVASAHFVPFRSQRWADLNRSEEALAFSRELWGDFISDMRPEFIMCLGTTVGKHIPDLFGVQRLEKRRTGWGDITMAVGKTRYGGQLAILPHLGTFKLFSRNECAPFVNAAFGPKSVADA